jgi:hypothetical protein
MRKPYNWMAPKTRDHGTAVRNRAFASILRIELKIALTLHPDRVIGGKRWLALTEE